MNSRKEKIRYKHHLLLLGFTWLQFLPNLARFAPSRVGLGLSMALALYLKGEGLWLSLGAFNGIRRYVSQIFSQVCHCDNYLRETI
jgi:hypothetical protein